MSGANISLRVGLVVPKEDILNVYVEQIAVIVLNVSDFLLFFIFCISQLRCSGKSCCKYVAESSGERIFAARSYA